MTSQTGDLLVIGLILVLDTFDMVLNKGPLPEIPGIKMRLLTVRVVSLKLITQLKK